MGNANGQPGALTLISYSESRGLRPEMYSYKEEDIAIPANMAEERLTDIMY